MLHRKIRSFVRRSGRITPSQKIAFEQLWLKYGVQLSDEPLSFSKMFEDTSNKPQIVEIGFGMGHSLITMAEQFPEYNFLGIEVYHPGVGAVLNAIHKKNLQNIRVISTDATDVFRHFANHTLNAVLIFFPDPWPKQRHHKRRLIQIEFVSQIIQKIKSGGYLHIATDWSNYAEHIEAVLTPLSSVTRIMLPNEKILPRSVTKFEQRGERLGHDIHDLVFKVL